MHQGEIKTSNYNTIPKTPESTGLFSIHPSLHAERSFSKYFQVQYCSSKCQKEDWDTIISAIGQADDTVLLSDCIYKLLGLVHLAEEYCSAFHVELVPEKTKLLGFSPPGVDYSVFFSEMIESSLVKYCLALVFC